MLVHHSVDLQEVPPDAFTEKEDYDGVFLVIFFES